MPAVPSDGARAGAGSGVVQGVESDVDLTQSVRSAKDILAQLSDAVISASKAREGERERGGQREAKCQPWSRQGFFQRLKTFSPATWFNKPAMISPTECSRHGWRNDGVDALLCESCKQRLTMSIHPSLNDESRRAVVLKLQAQMVADGHGQLCPWRDNPVPLSLTQLGGSSSHEVIWDCAHRMKALYKCETLPEVAAEFTRSEELKAVLEAAGCPKTHKLDPALILAACGWEARALPSVGGGKKSSLARRASAPELGAGASAALAAGDAAEVLLEEKAALIFCEVDQRDAGMWNFRTRRAPARRIDLLKAEGQSSAGDQEEGGVEGGKRRREEGDEGDSSIFTDPAKRARILGGLGEAAAEQAGQTFFGGGMWGAGRTVWGLVSPEIERISMGHRWAQAPLGALTQPAPAPGLDAHKRTTFHPIREHRAASPWVAGAFPLLPPSALPPGALASSPAWQQCLYLALSHLESRRNEARVELDNGAALGAGEAEAGRGEDPVERAHRSLSRWMP